MSQNPVLQIELALKDRVIERFNFDQDSVIIGRDPGADISIDNTSVSRIHAKIDRIAGGTYVIRDQGSTNGTFLNDEKIIEEPIRSNDVVTVGKFTLRVKIIKPGMQVVEDEPPVAKTADIDGTTVLSRDQMAKMMADVQKKQEAIQKTPGQGKAKEAAKGPTLLFFIAGGLIIVTLIVILVVVLL